MLKLNHIAIPYLAALLFIFGSILGIEGIPWYQNLTLPPWAPSEGIVALIWALIYVGLSWAALILWNGPHRDRRFRVAVALFALAFLANLAWATLFFYFHLFTLSMLMALVLAVIIALMMGVVADRFPKAALLMAPFLLWVLFAAYFTHTLGLLNA